MKITIDNLDKTYKLCMSTGSIREKSTDIKLIRSLKIVAEKGLELINSKSKDITKESTDWTFVFRDHWLRRLFFSLYYPVPNQPPAAAQKP